MTEQIKEKKTLLEEYLETSNKLIDNKIYTHRIINDVINDLLKLKLKMTNKGLYGNFIEDSIDEIMHVLRHHRRNI